MEPPLCVEQPTVPRRRYSREFKHQVVQESFAAGASIARVAQSHGINANLLHTWRWQFRREVNGDSGDAQVLVPIQLRAPTASQTPAFSDGMGQLEVSFGGARIIVQGVVSEATLRSVFNALRP